MLDEKLSPVSKPQVSNGASGSIGLEPAAIMSVLLRNIAPAQLPVVAE